MLIKVDRLKEYILAKLMVCGEVSCFGAAQNLPANPRHASSVLKEMVEEGILREYTYADGKRVYRANMSKGEPLMEDISPELFMHYALMAGNKDRRFKGAQEDRIKARGIYRVTEEMFDNGICCDLFNISLSEEGSSRIPQATPFNNSGAVYTPETIYSMLPPDTPFYLTNRITRSLNDKKSKAPRDLMHRSIGTLIKGTSVYSCYHVNTPGEMWWTDVEYQMAEALRKKCESSLHAFKDNNLKMNKKSSIFFFTSEKTYKEFMETLKKGRTNKIDPEEVYNLSYALMIGKDSKYLERILLEDNWKEKVDKVLSVLLSSSIVKNKVYDMEDKEGTPIFNYLGNNIGRMRKEKNYVMNHRSILVISKWQERYVKEAYGDQVYTFIMTPENIKELLDVITGNRAR